MPNKNTTRRDYLIVQRISRNDYPSYADLSTYLKEHGAKTIGKRTFQRDIANIKSNFDVEIIFDRHKNGWTINTESSVDFDKLLYFIGLAESSDMVLHSLNEKRELFNYLSIGSSTTFKGIENIGVLLQAIRTKKTIQFTHLNYETGNSKDYTAEPYLLKEFEGRWYLFAFVRHLAAFRTFGLDRISKLVVTTKAFKREKALEEIAQNFDNVYGLVYMPEQRNPPIEKVTLCFSDTMIKHLQALPLHHSQTIEKDKLTLRVIINRELENKLLSYGEHVKVLSPHALQKMIKHRLHEAWAQYR